MPKIVTSKQAIIEQSALLFLENGYHATSISMLSKVCNIQKAHFYYYFENKVALMKAVLNYNRNYFQKEVYEKTIEQDIPSESILVAVLDAIKKAYINLGGCLVCNTILETGNSSLFKDELTGFVSDFKEVLIELYYLKSNGNSALAAEKALQTIQDIQGGIVSMKLYKDTEYLKLAISRAKQIS